MLLWWNNHLNPTVSGDDLYLNCQLLYKLFISRRVWVMDVFLLIWSVRCPFWWRLNAFNYLSWRCPLSFVKRFTLMKNLHNYCTPSAVTSPSQWFCVTWRILRFISHQLHIYVFFFLFTKQFKSYVSNRWYEFLPLGGGSGPFRSGQWWRTISLYPLY